MSNPKVSRELNSGSQKRMIPLYIIDILEKETDENNALLPTEIKTRINELYGADTVRKTDTIVESIQAINLFYEGNNGGVPLIACQEPDKVKKGPYPKNKRYYLANRKLEFSEVLFLKSLLINSKAFSPKTNAYICQRLVSLLSKNQRQSIENETLSDGTSKTPNVSIYINFEKIQEAISDKKNIEFTYNEYNLNKELVPRVRDYKYIVSPYGVVNSYGDYFLIGNHYINGIRTYRVDKITNIRIVEDGSDHCNYIQKSIDLKNYVENSVFMHADQKKIDVDLHCEMRILDDVIERFSNSRLHPDPKSTQYFYATIPGTTKLGMLYWILEFSSACEVLKPEELREEVRKTLAKALSRYGG
jgi:predicted DNA-binding transcriptional regulator YafY